MNALPHVAAEHAVPPHGGSGGGGSWWSGWYAGGEQQQQLQGGKALALAGLATLVAGAAFYVLATTKVRVKKDRRLRSDFAPPPPFARGAAPSAAAGTPAYTPEEEKRYRTLLALLRSSDVEKQVQALKTLHQMSRQALTHDAMRQLGLLHVMLGMLKPAVPSATSTSKHPMMDYESVMVELTKVVANLASNNTNRLLMGESGSIKDLLRLLDIPNDEVKENLLRTIMNLSIAPENEDRIREEGGLSILLELFQDEEVSPALLLQTVRVLVNLSCNETNKTIMQKAGAVDRVVALLLTPAIDPGLAHRLVRLLGTFSVGSDLPVYEKITDRAVAQILINSLRKQMEKGEPDRDDKSFSEVLLMAIWRITGERAPKFNDALTKFQNMFIEESEADGSSGIDFIFPYLRLTSNEDKTLVIGCLNTLQNLSRGNDKVQAKLRGSGALNALKELRHSHEPVIAERAMELLVNLSTISATDSH